MNLNICNFDLLIIVRKTFFFNHESISFLFKCSLRYLIFLGKNYGKCKHMACANITLFDVTVYMHSFNLLIRYQQKENKLNGIFDLHLHRTKYK